MHIYLPAYVIWRERDDAIAMLRQGRGRDSTSTRPRDRSADPCSPSRRDGTGQGLPELPARTGIPAADPRRGALLVRGLITRAEDAEAWPRR